MLWGGGGGVGGGGGGGGGLCKKQNQIWTFRLKHTLLQEPEIIWMWFLLGLLDFMWFSAVWSVNNN